MKGTLKNTATRKGSRQKVLCLLLLRKYAMLLNVNYRVARTFFGTGLVSFAPPAGTVEC